MLRSTLRICFSSKTTIKPLARVAVFNTKSYDKEYFEKMNQHNSPAHQVELKYFDESLSERTAGLAYDSDAVCIFVNDVCNSAVIKKLGQNGVNLIALRCAGYNNVDLKEANTLGMKVVRVPAYSPQAVAEFAMALLLTLNRKVHKAYNRTREGNFALEGLMGFNLNGRTIGVVGTGKIGQAFVQICKGFGMNILCHDINENKELIDKYGVKYVNLEALFKDSDIISLHCPLNEETYRIINQESISQMKHDVVIINTGRGGLIHTQDVIKALKHKKIGGLAIDVYEQEEKLFFKDDSIRIMTDDMMARLLTFNNVIVTGHQAFFTQEAIRNICSTTLNNIIQIKQNVKCDNEVKQ